MRRRDFIAALGSAAGWPLMARSQQSEMPAIGFLDTDRPGPTGALNQYDVAFRAGLANSGFMDGANVELAYRYAENHADRLPTLAAELVRRGVAIIFAVGKPAALAATAATTTVPIVFVTDADPVELGPVENLSHLGGNITGVTFLTTGLNAERLKLLHVAVPSVESIGWLRNPLLREAQIREVEATARTLGVRLVMTNASTPSEMEPAVANLVGRGIEALLVGTDVLPNAQDDQLVGITARHALPAIYPLRRFAEAGGLMSYEATIPDAFYRAGTYAARILKGERPAELPVQQSTRFELVVNRNTARWLGINLPTSLLSRADDVID